MTDLSALILFYLNFVGTKKKKKRNKKLAVENQKESLPIVKFEPMKTTAHI